jgi:hypothetical protein
MASKQPAAELQPQFSSSDATPTAWAEAVRRLEQAEGGNMALVYEVAPTTAFGFGKGTSFSQTRWRF